MIVVPAVHHIYRFCSTGMLKHLNHLLPSEYRSGAPGRNGPRHYQCNERCHLRRKTLFRPAPTHPCTFHSRNLSPVHLTASPFIFLPPLRQDFPVLSRVSKLRSLPHSCLVSLCSPGYLAQLRDYSETFLFSVKPRKAPVIPV